MTVQSTINNGDMRRKHNRTRSRISRGVLDKFLIIKRMGCGIKLKKWTKFRILCFVELWIRSKLILHSWESLNIIQVLKISFKHFS